MARAVWSIGIIGTLALMAVLWDAPLAAPSHDMRRQATGADDHAPVHRIADAWAQVHVGGEARAPSTTAQTSVCGEVWSGDCLYCWPCDVDVYSFASSNARGACQADMFGAGSAAGADRHELPRRFGGQCVATAFTSTGTFCFDSLPGLVDLALVVARPRLEPQKLAVLCGPAMGRIALRLSAGMRLGLQLEIQGAGVEVYSAALSLRSELGRSTYVMAERRAATTLFELTLAPLVHDYRLAAITADGLVLDSGEITADHRSNDLVVDVQSGLRRLAELDHASAVELWDHSGAWGDGCLRLGWLPGIPPKLGIGHGAFDVSIRHEQATVAPLAPTIAAARVARADGQVVVFPGGQVHVIP